MEQLQQDQLQKENKNIRICNETKKITYQDVKKKHDDKFNAERPLIMNIGPDESVADDIHDNIELESVGKVDSDGKHCLTRLSKMVSAREVERYGRLGFQAILDKPAETHSKVKHSTEDNGD